MLNHTDMLFLFGLARSLQAPKETYEEKIKREAREERERSEQYRKEMRWLMEKTFGKSVVDQVSNNKC